MSEKNLLIPESLNALELFTQEGIDPVLESITREATSFIPDLETPKGRQEIKSMAHKVSRAKVALDNAGKDLVSGWKEKARVVDQSRKKAREYLDDLRDQIREPLSKWEAEEAIRIEEEMQREKFLNDWNEAITENALFDREAAIREAEEKIRREEEERQARESQAEAERLEAEAEERRQKEAAEREEAIRKEEAERAEREKQEAIERAEQEKQEAIDKAEREKREAIEQAEREKFEAIEAAQRKADQEQAERDRIEREREEFEQAERQAEEARKADVEHRRKINQEVMEALQSEGVGERTAKKIVTLAATGVLPYVSINY